MIKRTCYTLALIVALSICLFPSAYGQGSGMQPDPWLRMNEVLSQIKAPVFAGKDFVITKFGAVGNGKTNCSQAIKKAIEACNKAGGGRVVVPAGNYFTGPIYLKSNVNLHLQKGAVLLFSTRPEDYLPWYIPVGKG